MNIASPFNFKITGSRIFITTSNCFFIRYEIMLNQIQCHVSQSIMKNQSI